MNELAIASVCPQEWEEPCEPLAALQHGSMFECLRKPFFMEERQTAYRFKAADREEELLYEIQQVGFLLIDVTLFLDTHPEHAEALKVKQQCQERKKQLMKQFAEEYYPLTMECEGNQAKQPIPWERRCSACGCTKNA